MGRWLTLVLVAIAAALVAVAAAWASGTNKEPRHYTAADQALARSIVLTQADLGSAWKGGTKKVDTSPPPTCPNFNPQQSDLLVTGDAESEFSDSAAGVQYDSEAQILQTAHMVQLDWQRSIPQPGLLTCLRSILKKSLPANETIISVARVAIPKLATYSAEIRVVINVHSSTAKDVPVMIDELLVGRNRAEITLTTTSPYAERGPVEQSELRLAKLLVAREPATA